MLLQRSSLLCNASSNSPILSLCRLRQDCCDAPDSLTHLVAMLFTQINAETRVFAATAGS